MSQQTIQYAHTGRLTLGNPPKTQTVQYAHTRRLILPAIKCKENARVEDPKPERG
jgi:hypothetical protein